MLIAGTVENIMMKVLGPRALVKRITLETKSSLIEVVEFSAEPSQFALVLAVGKVPDVQVGDTVLLTRYCGASINSDDETMVMADDILAVVDL